MEEIGNKFHGENPTDRENPEDGENHSGEAELLAVQFNVDPSPEIDQQCNKIVTKYNELRKSKKDKITLDDVVTGICLPSEATHLVITLIYNQTQFSIPFNLNKREEFFPCESVNIIAKYDAQIDSPVEVVLMHIQDGQLVTEDMPDLYEYAWSGFRTGFKTYRQSAWSWLSKLSSDPEAIIRAKYPDGQCVCMSLQTFELFVF